MRILGIDPGLRCTGWGMIASAGGKLVHLDHGSIKPAQKAPLAARLSEIFTGIAQVIATHQPGEVAIEETFVNRNPTATLALGHARAAAMVAAAQAGLSVAEYAPNRVKKAVVGVGHADKDQVMAMITRLMPVTLEGADAADALAVAVAHAHFAATDRRLAAQAHPPTGKQAGGFRAPAAGLSKAGRKAVSGGTSR